MEYSPGLRGVVAGETAISTVGMEGTSLRYRGYDAIALRKKEREEKKIRKLGEARTLKEAKREEKAILKAEKDLAKEEEARV